jgi:hypothetical protein
VSATGAKQARWSAEHTGCEAAWMRALDKAARRDTDQI